MNKIKFYNSIRYLKYFLILSFLCFFTQAQAQNTSKDQKFYWVYKFQPCVSSLTWRLDSVTLICDDHLHKQFHAHKTENNLVPELSFHLPDGQTHFDFEIINPSHKKDLVLSSNLIQVFILKNGREELAKPHIKGSVFDIPIKRDSGDSITIVFKPVDPIKFIDFEILVK